MKFKPISEEGMRRLAKFSVEGKKSGQSESAKESDFIYNWYASFGSPAGNEWVSHRNDTEEIGKFDSGGNTIYDSTQWVIPLKDLEDFAEEILDAYAGGDSLDPSDKDSFIEWVGSGGDRLWRKLLQAGYVDAEEFEDEEEW